MRKRISFQFHLISCAQAFILASLTHECGLIQESPGQFWSLDIITVELFYSLSSSPTHAAVFCDKKGFIHSGHFLISSSGFTRKDVCVQKVEYIYKMLSQALSSLVLSVQQRRTLSNLNRGVRLLNLRASSSSSSRHC